MRRGPLLVLSLLCSSFIAAPALAQAGATTTTSWFKAFMWTDDLLGLANIWVLILMSGVSIGYMIQLAMKYRRLTIVPPTTVTQIQGMLAEKRFREAIEFAEADPSFLGKIVSGSLKEAGNGYSAMERAIEEVSDAEVTRMLRPCEWLNLVGNVSPMLGLFGTVYGMIVAFNQLVLAGGKVDPGALAAGISTALVTTFWGLVVAMPALSAYAIIRNRIDALTSEGVLIAEDLIKPFKPGAKKAAPASPAPAPRATPKPEAPAQG